MRPQNLHSQLAHGSQVIGLEGTAIDTLTGSAQELSAYSEHLALVDQGEPLFH